MHSHSGNSTARHIEQHFRIVSFFWEIQNSYIIHKIFIVDGELRWWFVIPSKMQRVAFLKAQKNWFFDLTLACILLGSRTFVFFYLFLSAFTLTDKNVLGFPTQRLAPNHTSIQFFFRGTNVNFILCKKLRNLFLLRIQNIAQLQRQNVLLPIFGWREVSRDGANILEFKATKKSIFE